MGFWDKLMGRGRRGHFLKLPQGRGGQYEKRSEMNVGGPYCQHCNGLPIATHEGAIVGYSHTDDCPVMRRYRVEQAARQQ